MPLGRPSDAGDNGVFFGGCESTIAQVRPGWAESAVGALGNASEEKKKKSDIQRHHKIFLKYSEDTVSIVI